MRTNQTTVQRERSTEITIKHTSGLIFAVWLGAAVTQEFL